MLRFARVERFRQAEIQNLDLPFRRNLHIRRLQIAMNDGLRMCCLERFCDLLDRMTRETDTRYLIVTHNAVTMSRMHRLYGVTMIEKGVSRLVSVDLGGAETLLAAE